MFILPLNLTLVGHVSGVTLSPWRTSIKMCPAHQTSQSGSKQMLNQMRSTIAAFIVVVSTVGQVQFGVRLQAGVV